MSYSRARSLCCRQNRAAFHSVMKLFVVSRGGRRKSATWQSGGGPSESARRWKEGERESEREAYCLSLIPLQEGLGLRTYSLLLESLSLIIASKSCCKVHTKKIFAFCLSHPLPPVPPFVCYLYSILACHPPSDSVPSRLCPSLIIAACIPLGPSHFLSPPPPLPSCSVLCFSISKYRGHLELHITLGLKMGVLWSCLLPVHSCCQASVGCMCGSVGLPPNFLYWIHQTSFEPKIILITFVQVVRHH